MSTPGSRVASARPSSRATSARGPSAQAYRRTPSAAASARSSTARAKSSRATSAHAEIEPPIPIPDHDPVFPWQEEVAENLGRSLAGRREHLEKMRQLYLPQHTPLRSEIEWRTIAESFAHPFKPRGELMCQLLTSVLCKHQSKRHAGDNSEYIAAGIRWTKGEGALRDMADVFEAHLSHLDADEAGHKPTLANFYQAYGVMQEGSQVVPAIATEFRYIPKPELASVLIKMGLTMGSYNKAARGRARRNAMAEKSRVKWNILSQLVDTKREGLAKMIVKDAVNLGCNVASAPSLDMGSLVSKMVFHNIGAIKKEMESNVLKEEIKDGGHFVQHHTEDADGDGIPDHLDEDALINSKEADGGRSTLMALLDDGNGEDAILGKDSLMSRVVKLAHLEDMFANVIKDPVELAVLWWDCDSNMNGDMSVTEWQQYATEKFSAIANKRANTKAFMESASESGCDAAAKGTGLALPVLSRSNFKLFLTRVFEYNKVHYAFDALDESGDDALVFSEYREHRVMFMKLLHFDCSLRKPPLTVRQEFDEMESYITEKDRRAFKIGKGTLGLGEKHVDEPFITFKSVAEWYRHALDDGWYSEPKVIEQECAVNTSGLRSLGKLVDIDEITDLLVSCNYKTRIKAIALDPTKTKLTTGALAGH